MTHKITGLLLSMIVLAPPIGQAAQPATVLGSVAWDRQQGNADSGDWLPWAPSEALSGDGRFLLFQSDATNLVPGDTNGVRDIFLRDLDAHTTECVSVANDGTQANAESGGGEWDFPASISADGRFIAFDSRASNLVPDDNNDDWDVFVRDRALGTIERASVSSTGEELIGVAGNAWISPDGRYVAFQTFGDPLLLRDRQTGMTSVVATPSDDDFRVIGQPRLSTDARFIAFVGGYISDQEWRSQVYMLDRETNTTRVVSAADGRVGNGSSDAPSISADGQLVAFRSFATNLTGDTDVRARRSSEVPEIFVFDARSSTIRLVSQPQAGLPALPPTGSNAPSISRSGRYIVFDSSENNLVSNDANPYLDVFRYDLLTGETTLVTVPSKGDQIVMIGESSGATISDDGRRVAFGSYGGPYLVEGYRNQCPLRGVIDPRAGVGSPCYDIFVRELP